MELAKRKVHSVEEVTALSDYSPYQENRLVESMNRGRTEDQYHMFALTEHLLESHPEAGSRMIIAGAGGGG